MSDVRDYLIIGDHPIKRYREKFTSTTIKDSTIKRILYKIYLDGELLILSKKDKLRNLLKYGGTEAFYYRLGNVVVVVTGSDDKLSTIVKTMLTCYPYKESKFED